MSRKSFDEQSRNAGRRGIPFLFTYEEWIEWWEAALGVDWPTKRGCTKGKYCMARIRDIGPYSPANVMCILHGQNVTDAAANNAIAFGSRAGNAILTESAAREIYISTEPYKFLADRYKVGLQTISDIRGRRTWRRVTADLTRPDTWGRNQWT